MTSRRWLTPLWASRTLPHRDNWGRFDGNWSGKRLRGLQLFGPTVTNWHDYATGFTWPVKEYDPLSRNERCEEGSRWISGIYGVQCGCGLIEDFYRCPVCELSSVSSLPRWEKKMENYHRRIVCESDREVFRGHVARARCRDATEYAQENLPRFYLFKYLLFTFLFIKFNFLFKYLTTNWLYCYTISR